jgi:hypothetical protein
MMRVLAVEPPSGKARDGDHERALRRVLAGEAKDTGLAARIEAENLLIPHNYSGAVDREIPCGHSGCQNTFMVRLVPGQLIYPRWCPFHRTPHRRSLTCADS